MKSFSIAVGIVLCCCMQANAQKFYTKNGDVSFFSKTNMEDIKADNNQVMSVLNVPTGELQFSLLVKNFHFEKALMEEHFNENYLESDKFPKSTFKGVITDIQSVNFGKDGTYPVNVSGELMMHGITNKVHTKGSIVVSAGKVTGKSVFTVVLADYKIAIPKVVEKNISKTIDITVNCVYSQKL